VPVERLLEAALQLRETKPALFGGALGVLIVGVLPDSQAAEKGLRPGDIVIAYAGEAMNSTDQLIEAVQAKASESRVVVQFIRGEKVEEIELKSGEMGVQLKDIPKLPKFWKQLIVALQTKDHQRILQLIRDNPAAKDILLEFFLNQLAEIEHPEEDTKFLKQLATALQSKDSVRIRQLVRDNPQMAKKLFPPDLLAKIEQLRPELERLQEEGEQAYSQSKYPLAVEKWQIGLERSQELKDKRYISRFLGNLGAIYLHLEQYSTALEYYKKVLVIDKEIGDHREEGSNLNNLGLVYFYLGQHSKALEYLQQDLAINEKLGNERGKGIDLANLGMVYYDLGQYPKALNSYQQALSIARDHSYRSMEGAILGNIGSVYRSLGQYPSALNYQLQSLIIFNELGDKNEAKKTLTNIGNVYDDLGQYSKALSIYQQALSISKEFIDKRGEGSTLGNIGSVYQKLGQYHEALEYSQKALSIFREIGNRSEEKKDMANIGGIYAKLGQYPDALNYYQQALSIAKELNTDDLWEIQANLASLEVFLNQSEVAINHYDEAINNLETLRTSLTSSLESSGIALSELKTQFMKDKFHIYDEFITLLQTEHQKHPDQGYDRKAFEVFEKKQGRVFLEQMGKSTAWRFTGVPEDISIKDRELENQVAAARKNLSDAYAKGKDVDSSSFRQHLETVEKAQRDFEEKLKADYSNIQNPSNWTLYKRMSCKTMKL
ncbi:MAG: hypothetical protein BWK79_19985, partial [Beggiatoa sp. IS2]